MKLSKGMRNLLKALPEHEGCLYPGATMGELKASGATPYLLRKAREEGWANIYTDNNREAPSYYRTSQGTKALELDHDA